MSKSILRRDAFDQLITEASSDIRVVNLSNEVLELADSFEEEGQWNSASEIAVAKGWVSKLLFESIVTVKADIIRRMSENVLAWVSNRHEILSVLMEMLVKADLKCFALFKLAVHVHLQILSLIELDDFWTEGGLKNSKRIFWKLSLKNIDQEKND